MLDEAFLRGAPAAAAFLTAGFLAEAAEIFGTIDFLEAFDAIDTLLVDAFALEASFFGLAAKLLLLFGVWAC